VITLPSSRRTVSAARHTSDSWTALLKATSSSMRVLRRHVDGRPVVGRSAAVPPPLRIAGVMMNASPGVVKSGLIGPVTLSVRAD
jgi:hypothetical protein